MATRLEIRGAVQGRGIRPLIARFAAERGWRGFARNTASGVEVVVAEDGPLGDAREELLRRIGGVGLAIDEAKDLQEEVEGEDFRILESTSDERPATPVPTDARVCDDCLREYADPSDRRRTYGLVGCVVCGPRYSSATAMPFDRSRTTFADFAICEFCRQEYEDSGSRRRHAQTIGCGTCGPRLWATSGDGAPAARDDEALVAAAKTLLQGGCVAFRGMGGYQLLADATSTPGTRKLRELKRRPSKPFAVTATASLCEALGEFDAASREALLSAANPIVLVRQLRPSPLAPEINPGLSDVGLMLPTTAAHQRLLDLTDRPLVCTSGNVDGEPLACSVEEASATFARRVDLFVHHDRAISQPIDDSVVRSIGGRTATIRLARGLAPLTLSIECPLPIVATGGQQKGAIALSNGGQAVLLPHVGDLSSARSCERWTDRLDSHVRLYGVEAPAWACDAHPDYFAGRLAAERGGRRISCWHHHAHAAAGMLEHGWLDRRVLAVAWDGAGYGPDGTSWGGEFLVADVHGFRRVARLRPFGLVGGDAAAREIGRNAVSVLSQLPEMTPSKIAEVLGACPQETSRRVAVSKSPATPRTSSVGRLFDAVAALALRIERVSYEGEGAAVLESLCDSSEEGAYPWRIGDGSCRELDWRPTVRAILDDLQRGVSPSIISARFLRSLARLILHVSRRHAELPYVLGGGVFQNRALIEMLLQERSPSDPRIGLPGQLPVNDGGLAAGQLAIAAARLAQERGRTPCA